MRRHAAAKSGSGRTRADAGRGRRPEPLPTAADHPGEHGAVAAAAAHVAAGWAEPGRRFARAVRRTAVRRFMPRVCVIKVLMHPRTPKY